MTTRLLPRFIVFIVAFATGSLSAFAAEIAQWRIDDAGQPRDFVLVDNEVYIEQAGPAADAETFAETIRTALPGAVPLRLRGRGAHVQLPTDIARQQSIARSGIVQRKLPGTQVAPVLYFKDAFPSAASRRIVSNEVLVEVSAGAAATLLADDAGANAVKATLLESHQLLVFSDAYRALDGAAVLRSKGVKAEPQLRIEMKTRDIPNDPFFPQQWHLRNIGQGGGVASIDANVTLAWDITKGRKVDNTPIRLAIIDDGVELDHPDLTANTVAVNTGFHADFNDNDNDPSPDQLDRHGTPVAGIVAAAGNNLLGGSGVAREAQFVGLRLLAAPFSDQQAANALFWRPAGFVTDAANNSWGPSEGSGLAGPGPLARTAMQQAAQTGRGGLGLINVFAAGNGAILGDDSNFDGYANSRFGIAVSSVNNAGNTSLYSEPGANILLTAPDDGGSLKILTTDLTGLDGYNGISADLDYTDLFGGSLGGTSASTAIVTGGVALMLAANPALGWRDVHEILTSTARKIQDTDPGWDNNPTLAGSQDNEAGFKFHHNFGGGLIDISASVIRALDWTNLSAEQTQSIVATGLPADIPDDPMNGLNVTRILNFTGANLRVERVVVRVNIIHAKRSELSISLISPAGTESKVVPVRALSSPADPDEDFIDWDFSTTHHWGENSQGNWTLRVTDNNQGSTGGQLVSASVSVFGSTSASKQRFRFVEQEIVVPEPTASVTLNVARLGGTTGTASVNYVISPRSSATAGEDFTSTSGTLNFGAGVATMPINIPLLNDTLSEPLEEIYVLLRAPVGASLGGVTVAKIRISDDEANVVTVTATDPAAREATVSAPPDPGEFTIQRNAPEPFDLAVSYVITGTAVDGVDYVSLAGGATIPANETFVKVPIQVIDDQLGEGSETVTITLVDTPLYDIGVPDTATVTIFDNDVPHAEILVDPAATPETSTAPVTYTVKRETAGLQPLDVNLFSYGTAQSAVNFIPPVPATVTIPAGESSVTFTITPVNNSTYQGTTTLFVQIAPGTDYLDGFSTRVRLSFLDDDPLPDPKPPTTRIDVPVKNARVNAPGPVLAEGVADDNGLVTQVLYRVSNNAGDGPWRLATGGAVWQADITADCQPGPNVLSAYSVDDFANQSPIVTRSFTFVQTRTLTVNVVGSGSVTAGFSPSSQRDAGVTYTITAKAQSGSIFNGWTGDITSPGRELTFVMPNADATLTASFIASPFATANPPLTGKYVGLFRDVTYAVASSGFVQFEVDKTGAFSGFLLFGKEKVPLKGEFNGSGRFVGTIPRKGGIAIAADLTLDVVPGATERITGTLNGGSFVSAAVADRAVYHKATNPYPGAIAAKQVFTFLIPASAALGSTQPHGHGYATMSVNAGGVVKWKGQLGDGSVVDQAVPLSKANTFPLFAAPYKNGGAMQGPVAIATQPTTDVAGLLDWGKAANNKDVDFPTGFVLTNVALEGSLYVPPAPGVRVLPGLAVGLNNANGLLEDGRLESPINKVLTWDEQNKINVVAVGPDALKLVVDPKTGLVEGSFFHPVAQKKTTLKGVAVQKQNRVGGQFRGTLFGGTNTQFGRLLVTPAP